MQYGLPLSDGCFVRSVADDATLAQIEDMKANGTIATDAIVAVVAEATTAAANASAAVTNATAAAAKAFARAAIRTR